MLDNNTLPDIRKADVASKTVLLRLDLDVPFENGKILDDTRLEASIPTLTFLLEHNALVIILGHAGRPEGVDKQYSLEPIAEWYQKQFTVHSSQFPPKADQPRADQLQKIGEFEGWKLSENLSILENLRFYPGEKKNDLEFTKQLASLGDIYVNDAFAVCHRDHASVVGIAQLLPHFAGIHVQKEIEVLSKIINQPVRPWVMITGGAKIETKLPLLERMHHFADYVLVGGKIAQETRELLKVQHEELGGIKSILLVADLDEQQTDITHSSIENFLQVIQIAQTIVWNGPVGKIEKGKVGEGNRRIAEGMLASGAYTVVGGGDTLGFLKQQGLLDKFSFISTGGGSMLAFLSGENLPGLDALLK